MRNPDLVVYSLGDMLHLLRPGMPEMVVGPTDPVVISRALEELGTAVERSTLEQLFEERTAARLVERGVLLAVPPDQSALNGSTVEGPALDEPVADPEPVCGHLLIAISGAIASVESVPVLRPLLSGFAEKVDVIVTDAAARFVRPEAFARLGASVRTDDDIDRAEVTSHMDLAAPDLIVVWPASAATIAKLADGSGNDLLSLAVAGSGASTVLFPAMNHAMWRSASVRRNVARVRDDGYVVIEPGPGREVSNVGGGDQPIGAAGMGAFTMREILESVVRAVAEPG